MNTQPDSQVLMNLIGKIADTTSTVDIRYMDEELGMLINMITRRLTRQAHKSALDSGLSHMEALAFVIDCQHLLSFQLGLLIGQELEKTRAFEEQIGDVT